MTAHDRPAAVRTRPEPPAHRRHRRPGAAPAAARPPHDRDDAGAAQRCCSGCSTCSGRTCPTPPGQPAVFDRVGLTMLGIFPFVVMFLVTSIAMLRERTSGTLERLLTTPLSRLDLLLGYGARVRAGRRGAGAWSPSRWRRPSTTSTSPGRSWLVVLIAVVDAVLGVALGLLASAFARSEFQAVQFMPVIVLPQFFLCGLLVPREQMAGWLQAISDVLPLTYAVEALQEVGAHAEATGTMWRDIGVVAGAAVLALALAAATLRRRTS